MENKVEEHSVALVCMEEAYEEVLQEVKAPEDIRYDFVTYYDEEYVFTFDALFIFSSDPMRTMEEASQTTYTKDWSSKAIVFVVPEKNIYKAKKVLEEEIAGLISCEKFLEYSSESMKMLRKYSFILEPMLNYEIADAVKNKRERQLPIKRFVLQQEKVDIPLKKPELAILQLLLDGKGTVEMAEELFYSVKTVKRYISNLIRAIGTADRTGVVVHAIRKEWAHCERDENQLLFN